MFGQQRAWFDVPMDKCHGGGVHEMTLEPAKEFAPAPMVKIKKGHGNTVVGEPQMGIVGKTRTRNAGPYLPA